jgi:HK97 family phage portal protein
LGFLADLLWEKRDTFGLRGESPWSFVDMSANPTKSGASVSENTALSLTAVWACIRVLAWTKASLPLITYRRLPQGKERAHNNPKYKLLHDSPNPEQTSFAFRSLISVWQNLWGAGLAEIEIRAGEPYALWPIPPWTATPIRKTDKSLWYEIKVSPGITRILPSYQVYVLPSLQTSADNWLSPIGVHRETIGLSMAMNEFGAKTFGQGTNPSGILLHPGRLREQSEESIRDKFKKQYEGLSNSHRLMLLEEGMKFERVGLPPEDAQYLESRRFSIYDICRIYSVPAFMVQETEKSTSFGTGIEEMNLGMITYTMRPYLVQDEQEIKKKIFNGDDEYFAEYNLDALMRGRTLERYQAYQIGSMLGMWSIDELREKENENPLPDGKGSKHYVQLNMQAVEDPPKEVEDTEKAEGESTTKEPVGDSEEEDE